MDKVTRILLLYSKLIQGEEVNKTIFCFENECSARSFDRYISTIRLFLSDSFSSKELVYDRIKNVYFIPGSQSVQFGIMEYFFIERVLKDTGILRKDELEILTKRLALNAESPRIIENYKKVWEDDYKTPVHNKALLKIYGDLVTAICRQNCIQIVYYKLDGEAVEREIIPCLLKYDLGYIYLVAYLKGKEYEYPAYFRLDRIESFIIMGQWTSVEEKKVRVFREKYSKGITQMYAGEFKEILVRCKKEYLPYVLDKFKDAEEVKHDDNSSIVKIRAFEDGFIKWMMSQSADKVCVKEPESTRNKLMEEALKIVKIYGEN